MNPIEKIKRKIKDAKKYKLTSTNLLLTPFSV